MGMWDTVVNEVESVGLGVAEAVKDEVIAIEEDIAKIEEVAGELAVNTLRSYLL